MKTNGGKFFGEGTYGCTFSPPPKCDREEVTLTALPKDRKNIIAKVFKDKDDINVEWKYSEAVSKLDPKQRIFLYLSSHCPVKVRDVKKDRQWQSCSIATHASTNSTLHMALMKRGGITLDEYCSRKGGIPLKKFIHVFLPVLEGVAMLIKGKIVHQDLKFNNILYDAKNNTTNIIDFGLATGLKEAYDSYKNDYLLSEYWLHPPEYLIAQYIYEHPIATATTEQCYDIAKKLPKILDINFDESTQQTLKYIIMDKVFTSQCEYEGAFVKFMTTVLNNRRGNEALAYLQKYANRIDMYSVGVNLAFFSTYIKFSDEQQRDSFMSIIKALVYPDPRKRPGPSKAITMLKNLI
jgi:serine/threonine protein kinase